MTRAIRRATKVTQVARGAWAKVLSRGQAMVEFAMVLTVALFVLLLGIQYALIGQAALALNQLAYQGARYASIYAQADPSTIKNYMLQVGSPTITKNNGSYLGVAVNPTTTPRQFGHTVTVSLTFDASGQLFLPNPFLGLITFPTTLTAQESALTE